MSPPDAVQFRTRLTRRDLVWYFVRHYFFDLWLPWILAFGTAGVYAFLRWRAGGAPGEALLVLLGLGAGMLAAMFGMATLLYALRMRKLEPDGLVLQPRTVTVDDGGILVEGSATTARFDWRQVRWVKPKGQFLFVRLRAGDLQLMYPQRDLPAGTAERVQALHAAFGVDKGSAA